MNLQKAYVDSDYKITDKLIEDIENDKMEVPAALLDLKESVCALMQNIHSAANLKAGNNEKADNIHENPLKPNDNFAKMSFRIYGRR